MNHLCICAYGHSRSVALARRLHNRNMPAISCGYITAGTAISVLAKWADKILIVDPEAVRCVPLEFRSKCLDFNVGPDVWSDPYNRDLQQRMEEKIVEILGYSRRPV